MTSRFLKSHAVRQLLGASTGMLVAGLIYVGMQQVSTLQLNQAMLVSPSTVSEKAGQVRVNDKNVNDATLRLIARRAQAVAAQLNPAPQTVATEAPVTGNAADRHDRRVRIAELRDLAANAQVFAPTPPEHITTVEDRLAQRTERVMGDTMHAGAAIPYAVAPTNDPAASDNVVAMTQPSPDTAHMRSGKLPSSGLGLNVLLLLSFTGAFLLVRPDLKRQLVAAISPTL